MPERHASSEAAVSTSNRDNEAEPAARRSTAERVRVLLPLPLPDALDYRAPEDRVPPEPGSFVRVPLGGAA